MKKKILPIIIGATTILVTLCGCGSEKNGRTDLKYDEKGFAKTKIDFVDYSPFSNETHKLDVYYKEESFVPYVTLEDMSSSLSNMLNKDLTFKTENGKSSICYDDIVYIVFDSSSNSIIENRSFSLFEFEEEDDAFDYSSQIDDNWVAGTEEESRTISLSEYSYNLYEYNGNVLIPYFVLEYSSFSNTNILSVYNGNNIYAFYSTVFSNEQYTEIYNTRDDKYYNSKEKNELTYNSLRLLFDNYYGLTKYNNMDGSVFESNKDVYLNGSIKDVNEQIVKDIAGFDDPHTSLWSYSIDSYFYGVKANYTNSKRMEKVIDAYNTLKGYSKEAYMEYGNTAYCSLDTFAVSVTGKPDDETNTHVILSNALKRASENPNITNFVIDVSKNLGGNIGEMYRTVGMITDNPLYIATYNNSLKDETIYKVLIDSDSDGDYTDNDSYAGRFNFYIETSAASFSAGNSFPLYSKYYAGAKIIGERSSGGACTVRPVSLPNGMFFQMSSSSVLYIALDKDDHIDKWISEEEGCPIDIEITDYSKFNDIEYLNKIVNA